MSPTPPRGPLGASDPGRPVRTAQRRADLLCTAALGALGGSVVLGLPPQERTFAAVVAPVQLSMSLLVPLVGILLASDLRRARPAPGRRLVLPAVLGALLAAELLAVVGILLAALAVVLAPTTAPDRWRAAGLLVVGSLLTQVVAVLTGTGFGLLVPSRTLAFGLTLLPAPLWLALGVAGPARAVRHWILPYGAARHLLGGTMTAASWGQVVVVLALWGVGLNALGVRRLDRSLAGQPPAG